MEKEVFLKRLEKVQARMEERGISCFLVVPSSTMRYLTGYAGRADERLLTLVLAAERKPFILANKLYELQVESAPVDDFVYWSDGENAIHVLKDALKKRDVGTSRIAVDKSMPGMFLVPLTQEFSWSYFCLGNDLVDDLRVYKDEVEMEAMMTACSKASEALKIALDCGNFWVGKTEMEFMGQFNLEMTKLGLEAPGALVAVGKNAAVPHHSSGQTVIESGKCMLVDFGGSFGGYRSDMTRTVHFGEPSDEFKKIYEIVREANLRGQAAAKVGNLLQDVDRAARNYIESKGYGEYFTHRTGHGIGLDTHEGPPAADGVIVPISEGMAFSIEPGIYLPGKFGVRIEDQALITKDGLRILHDFPRELQVIR